MDLEGAAHQFGELAGDRQAQAGTAIATADGAIRLGEGLEELRLLRLGQADAGVFHRQAEMGPARFADGTDADQHMAPLGELDRIAQQIDQHLLQAQRIAFQRQGNVRTAIQHQFDALLVGLDGAEIERAFEHLGQVEAQLFELGTTGFVARIVEHVVDHPQQGLARVEDLADVAALFAGQPGAQGQAAEADHRIERGADLVAHGRQEQRLGGRRFLGPDARLVQFEGPFADALLQGFVDLRVLQGDRRLGGQDAQHLQPTRGEGLGQQVVFQIEDADQAPLAQHRQATDRPRAPRANVGVADEAAGAGASSRITGSR